jgi:NAD(P)-dependent dehydrogenase (short-subunit alcohol dehydrogenase family)
MNRIVLITGVAGGIGAATAKVFNQAGWQTIGVDRAPSGKIEFLDRYVCTDLADQAAIISLFDDLKKIGGRLDALVNNAAVQAVKSLVETEPEEWDEVLAINVKAAYLTIKYAYPLLSNNGGSIINVSSVHAVVTSENMAAYATSKGALGSLTRAAALELAPDNIRVNAVLPGAVDTAMLRSGLARDHVEGETIDERLDMLARNHPLGRVGKPEEIGEVILFLADSQKSAFITGQTLIVDGGATARLSTE